jgi:hypothetical protein
MPQAICRFEPCSKEFDRKRPWQDFCRPKCRTQYWNLKNPRISALLRVLNTPDRTQLRQQIQEEQSNLGRPVDFGSKK